MNKKFRAYYKPDLDTPDGALKFEQKEFNDELCFVYDDDIKYPFYIPFMDDDWVVQQYTGYDDKDGNKIYEGDILKCTWYDVEPFFRKVMWWKDSGMMLPNASLTSREVGNVVIVGNIMENPELVDKYNL